MSTKNMQEIAYQYNRELNSLTPRIVPMYMEHDSENRRAWLINAIYLICASHYDSASVAYNTVRLYDRCMSYCVPELRNDFGFLATTMASAFSITHKLAAEDSSPLNISIIWRGLCGAYKRGTTKDSFWKSVLTAELDMASTVDWQPMSPTPFEYTSLFHPDGTYTFAHYSAYSPMEADIPAENVAVMCLAFLFAPQSTMYNSLEITLAALILAHSPVDCVESMANPVDVHEIHVKMLEMIDKGFSAFGKITSGLARLVPHTYAAWIASKHHP